MNDTPPASPLRVEQDIRRLAELYAAELKSRIDSRMLDMEADDNSHYLIYKALGVPEAEGKLIDSYQNKGRFLYNHAGSFLERATKLCFIETFPASQSVRIPNNSGQRPKTFEIDCLVDNKDALEIKWRDATTDGDHITKEHARMRAIAEAGYNPIRVMFYYPNREQAIRVQKTLETLYAGVASLHPGVKGEYHYGNAAWEYVKRRTNIDLKAILEAIARENTAKWQTSKL